MGYKLYDEHHLYKQTTERLLDREANLEVRRKRRTRIWFSNGSEEKNSVYRCTQVYTMGVLQKRRGNIIPFSSKEEERN